MSGSNLWSIDTLSWTCLDLLTSCAGCVCCCIAHSHVRCNTHTRAHTCVPSACLQLRDGSFFFLHFIIILIIFHSQSTSASSEPLTKSSPIIMFSSLQGEGGLTRRQSVCVGGIQTHTRGLVATSFMRRRRAAKTVSNQCFLAAIYIQRCLSSDNNQM